MIEINSTKPVEVLQRNGKNSFQIRLDTREFGKYKRKGIVKNIKVAQAQSYHDLATSIRNPSASAGGSLLEIDVSNFGRS